MGSDSNSSASRRVRSISIARELGRRTAGTEPPLREGTVSVPGLTPVFRGMIITKPVASLG
jgi:hypothetical protein